MKKIIFKEIIGYEGLYQISNYGDIKNKKGKLLKPQIKRGYYQIGLRKNGHRKWHQVHRLIAQAFILNPNNLPQINHKDENKLNNNLDNLEWCSVLYNNIYGTRLERVSNTNKLKKVILQLDVNGNILKKYNSIKEAEKNSNISASNISRCANNFYKTAGGYIWKFESVVMPNA